jgi:steroid delta-isomerase-like uncharacterized protein
MQLPTRILSLAFLALALLAVSICGCRTPKQTKTAEWSPVRRYFEQLWNKADVAVADQILATNVVFRGPFASVDGVQQFKQFIPGLLAVFPDNQFTIEEEIAAGDRMVVRFTMRGTQRGEFRGHPPSGKRYEVGGVDIFRVADGKIIEIRACFDTLRMMQQLGVMPPFK